MDSREEANYRLSLSEGFLKEAEDYHKLSHWRSCVSSSQLGVENACKGVLALYYPLVKTHDLSSLLLKMIEEQIFHGELAEKIEKLADNARILGFEEHIRTDYGDELAYKTPWEIYQAEHAENAFALAKDSYNLAKEIIAELTSEESEFDEETDEGTEE